ncbi:hypothetical protein [Falsiroseomonas oryziterrae]|uniref:hypothetical protein n=1 Tax=Falsiroseomonas oryziterrae TaxID=2911368 RepID=UPI001F16B3D0|nr:hypothetical protein [Roseomonas sp. NPKOSM-4]
MRHMVLAMGVLALALALATLLEMAGVEQSLGMLALVGGVGGLAGGIAMDLLQRAARG